jgi:hypothetical protein
MEDIDSLDLVRDDINAWRAAHRGRQGPLPIALRRRAGIFAQALGEDLVAEELLVSPRLLLKWGDRYAKALARREPRAARDATPAFVELRPQLPAAGLSRSDGQSTCIELTRPDGR